MNYQPPEIEDVKITFQTLATFGRRLWPYIRPYRAYLFLSFLLLLTSTVFTLLTPWLLGYAVDHVFLPKNSALLVPLVLGFFVISVIRAVSTFAQSYILTLAGQYALHDLRQDLLKHYQFYPIDAFNRTPVGRLVTRLVNDTASLQELFTSGLAMALGNVAIVLGIVLWLLASHFKLGLICISVFPLMIFISHLFSSKIRKAYHQSRTALSRLNTHLAENILGMWIIQIFNKQEVFKKRFSETSHHYTLTQGKTTENFAYFVPLITVINSLSMSILIWYGGYCATLGNVSLGLLFAFMSYIQALFSPVRDITEKMNVFISAMASCERIFEFMDRTKEPSIASSITSVPRAALQGAIDFRDVSFHYVNDKDQSIALKNLNFSIRPGEQIGIVGHTGAGKTTITSLLMRFYDPQKGQILLDGVDASQFQDKREIRQSIGFIQQSPFLFSGTIEDNIFLWNATYHENFKNLPDFARRPFESGKLLMTKTIFEGGANLSAGERQMISFMRALVHTPSIFILDEATAHLDPLSEQWIQDVSSYAFKGKTILVIAHRLATLKSMDRIFVLHHGELAETGTHQQLLTARGLYYKLRQIQLRKEPELCQPPSSS